MISCRADTKDVLRHLTFVRAGWLGLMVVAGLAVACGSSSGSSPEGNSTENSDTTSTDGEMGSTTGGSPDEPGTTPMIGHLNGQTEDRDIHDYTVPVADAEVITLELEPALEAVSENDGTFAMDVPHGLRMFRIEHPDYWSVVSAYSFSSNGETHVQFPLVTRTFIDGVAEALGHDIDPDLGIVRLNFDDSWDGGESATLSANYGDVFVFGGVLQDGTFRLHEVNELQGDSDFMFFANVEPGTTTIDVEGVEGVNCELEFGPDEVPEWPVVAGAMTLVEVECRSL